MTRARSDSTVRTDTRNWRATSRLVCPYASITAATRSRSVSSTSSSMPKHRHQTNRTQSEILPGAARTSTGSGAMSMIDARCKSRNAGVDHRLLALPLANACEIDGHHKGAWRSKPTGRCRNCADDGRRGRKHRPPGSAAGHRSIRGPALRADPQKKGPLFAGPGDLRQTGSISLRRATAFGWVLPPVVGLGVCPTDDSDLLHRPDCRQEAPSASGELPASKP